MHKPKTIHIFGASGSGTTTLAKAIASRFGYHFIDTDEAIWENTDPPFAKRKPHEESRDYVEKKLNEFEYNVISGAFVGWGDVFKSNVDLFIYMHLPLDVRLERIQKREENRFKERILPGGDLYLQHLDFLDWVSQYEELDESTRSQKQHQKWLQDVNKPILMITEVLSIEALIERVEPLIRLS